MMREVMQNAGLAFFAEWGLALFFAAFVAIVARALLMKRGDVEHLSNLPLEDGPSVKEV
jgi:cbb3-type cytochrome oxidase subunit 3